VNRKGAIVKATKCNKKQQTYRRHGGLTVAQQSAIDLLLAGKTDGETAEAVSVHRVTVTKWRLYDPWFQAELSRRRHELFGAAAERLRAMVPQALTIVEEELGRGFNVFLALRVLRMTGLDEAGAVHFGTSETDAEAIIAKQVAARVVQKNAERHKYQSPTELLLEEQNPAGQRLQDEAIAREAREEVLAEIAARLADGEPAAERDGAGQG
jgi:hypothetical protein